MTEARITLDAAALEELRGRTFLPGPVTTDRLVQQSAAALDLQDRVATLEATCRKLELDAAEAMALNGRQREVPERPDDAEHHRRPPDGPP